MMRISFFYGLPVLYACALSILGAESTGSSEIVQIPEVAKPGYLETYIDTVFGSQVTRITGDGGTKIPAIGGEWNEVVRHNYSKISAWNCDQSLLFLGLHHGFPSMLFFDGLNYEPQFGRNQSPGTELRWHPSDPDLMVYVLDNVIGFWNPRSDITEVVATFADYSDFHIGPWEGNLSRDGRMLVIVGKKGEAQVAFAYDLVTGRKYSDLVFKDGEVDWVSVSASGKFIVLNGRLNGERGDQTQVYDLEGKRVGRLWGEYGRPSHFDLAIDENGDDIAVGVSKSKPDDGRVIKRRLRDGKVTVLTSGGYASHTSTRNVQRPGWAYVTYQHPGPTWAPYWNEVIAVRLDGSMQVERIAHLYSKRVDYLTEAHALPSPDGKRVLWASSWGADSGRPISVYVAEPATFNE